MLDRAARRATFGERSNCYLATNETKGNKNLKDAVASRGIKDRKSRRRFLLNHPLQQLGASRSPSSEYGKRRSNTPRQIQQARHSVEEKLSGNRPLGVPIPGESIDQGQRPRGPRLDPRILATNCVESRGKGVITGRGGVREREREREQHST